jgi:hypothetical protein
VHSLLLRLMAERSVSAFNREYRFPYLTVFADRSRVEKVGLGYHRLESEEGLRRSLASSELGRGVRVETPITWIGAIAALLCLVVGYGLRLRP